MTLIELTNECNRLAEIYPPSTMIVRRGYEGGYKEVDDLNPIALKLNEHTDWYYGPHEEVQKNQQHDCVAIQIY